MYCMVTSSRPPGGRQPVDVLPGPRSTRRWRNRAGGRRTLTHGGCGPSIAVAMPEPNPALDSARDRADLVDLKDQQRAMEVVAQSVLGLWDVVNNLARLRPSRRDGYRVSIFGSARIAEDQWVYAAVRDMAAELTRLGCTIGTGGGPGLMQAANEGAAQAAPPGQQRSVGIRVELPFEQDVNPFVTSAFEHRTFFSRLHQFVLVSDAFVVVPGGIGTVLETMMIWQLLQVRKLGDTPLILVGPMWTGLVDWHRRAMLRPGFELASPGDMDIPQCVPGAAEAIAILRRSVEQKQARDRAR